jgi:hypothetical protein
MECPWFVATMVFFGPEIQFSTRRQDFCQLQPNSNSDRRHVPRRWRATSRFMMSFSLGP